MKARHTPQSQQKSQNRPEQIRERVAESRRLGPNRPESFPLTIQPEFDSVVVHQVEINAVWGLPNSQGGIAGFIRVRADVCKFFGTGRNCALAVGRTPQMNSKISCVGKSA